jgi:ABC-type glucose/galactose transport system permease subunit
VKRRAALAVLRVQTHVLLPNKEKQGRWLVALSGNMQYVSTINIFDLIVCLHFINQYLNKFKVAMESRKVNSCKLFISKLVCPDLQRLHHWLLVFV